MLRYTADPDREQNGKYDHNHKYPLLYRFRIISKKHVWPLGGLLEKYGFHVFETKSIPNWPCLAQKSLGCINQIITQFHSLFALACVILLKSLFTFTWFIQQCCKTTSIILPRRTHLFLPHFNIGLRHVRLHVSQEKSGRAAWLLGVCLLTWLSLSLYIYI